MTQSSVDDLVLDFYSQLFGRVFSEPFRGQISERRRCNVVIRQVEEAVDAASSSLTRFFLNQKLNKSVVEGILTGLGAMGDLLQLANPNVTTEEIVENLLGRLPCPETVKQTHDAVYRLALYTIVQVLMLVGPVMAEWQKLNFSSTFELPRRVVNRLNEISEQINAQGQSGQVGADESYELQYRDYLLQRFHRVEAGTVRMTTNLDVDLRELFVMPCVLARPSKEPDSAESTAQISLMNLAAARSLYECRYEDDESFQEVRNSRNKSDKQTPTALTALEQVKRFPRNVIVGLPGAGKSTFFEWLQVKLASVEEQFILGDQQAIPLLLLERRPNIFGFAHLTFQEYLAARAVHEGNRLGVDAKQLVCEHDDGRWKEVIALYCGLATTPAVRDLLESLVAQPDTESLSEVLTEAYLSAGSELAQDLALRLRVLKRIAIAPIGSMLVETLQRFPTEEVAPIANSLVGEIESNISFSEAYRWLNIYPKLLDVKLLTERLRAWQNMSLVQIGELVHFLHGYAPDTVLAEMATAPGIYALARPFSQDSQADFSQAEFALLGLSNRDVTTTPNLSGFEAVLLTLMRTLLRSRSFSFFVPYAINVLLRETWHPQDLAARQEFASLARQLAEHMKIIKVVGVEGLTTREEAINTLNSWADSLEGVNTQVEKKFRKFKPAKSRANKTQPRRR